MDEEGDGAADNSTTAPPPWVARLRSPLTDATILVTLGTVIAYFSGRLYLESFYSRLGIPESEVRFDIPYVMKSSFLPFLEPLFFLVLASILAMMVSQFMGRQIMGPFHPIPNVSAITLIFGLWAAWLLSQLIAPPAPVVWIGWSRRAFLFFLLGAVWFIALLVASWRSSGIVKPWPLTGLTFYLLVLFMAAAILTGWSVAINHEWPHSPFESALLAAGLVYVGYRAVYDYRRWPARRWGPHPFRRPARSYGMTLSFAVLTTICSLLTAGLGGSLAGLNTARGCEPLKTITFDPIPESLLRNHTYGFILRSDGYYYIHEIQPWKNETIMIAEAGRDAKLGGTSPNPACT